MEKNIEEKKNEKINFICINSDNKFKIMDNMHLALVNDHFQKTLGILEENAFGNFFQIFFNKIFPIKANSDLYFQNNFLVDKFLSQNQIKEIKDISESMNYTLNFDYKQEFFLSKEMIEHIGNILLFGFAKIKNKFKLYLIKSYADFKEKIETIKFNQIDLLNEYYNQEFFMQKKGKNKNLNIKKYLYFKEPFVDNEGKVLGKESKLLPNELILLLNKLQYIKTISFQVENIFNDINNNTSLNSEMVKYLIILINIQWLLPNILVVNFNLTNKNLSNALIDIMSLKFPLENKSLNFFEKKNYYNIYTIPVYNYDNYDLITKQINKTNKEIIFFKEKNINLELDDSDDDDFQNNENSNKKISRKEKINEIYNDYINKYNKIFDLIIITTYFIRILDKLHALNMKCPDTFCAEFREGYKNIKNSNDINFLNLLIDVKQLNILNIEFNSLDFSNFEKILGIINSNINLSSLKLIFFSCDKFYSLGGLYKIINDINDPELNLDLLDNNINLENNILNQFFLEKFQKNLEILSTLVKNRRKTLNELCLVLNIPSLLLNNDNYILSLIKFIINIFIFLCFEKNQIKIFKLISPLIKLDNRKTIFLNQFFGKIGKNHLDNIHTLFLQLNLCRMNNIVNLIKPNLKNLSIGNLDNVTFSSFVDKITNDEFILESKLVNVKIILNEGIIEYNDEIKNNFVKLFRANPKNLINFEIITNIKINYEQLHELINNIKKNYINKYIITFNLESKNAVDEIIEKDLPYVVNLNKENEQDLKLITKIIKGKIKENNEDKNKSFELRKKVFNNIKTFLFDKKDIKFEFI